MTTQPTESAINSPASSSAYRIIIHEDGRVDWEMDSGTRYDSLIRIPPAMHTHSSKPVADALRLLADHIEAREEQQ